MSKMVGHKRGCRWLARVRAVSAMSELGPMMDSGVAGALVTHIIRHRFECPLGCVGIACGSWDRFAQRLHLIVQLLDSVNQRDAEKLIKEAAKQAGIVP
jgi:hypothetical protein